MAPRQSSAPRRSTATAEQVYDLGVRGRKTGVLLKDSGARDEFGMQPLDDLFSSPDKESRNGADEPDDESDEEPMDIDEVTAPAPSAFMKDRPPARVRSPPKTNLRSPARRAPGYSSSPLRAAHIAGSPSNVRAVQRQLDSKKNNGLLVNKPTLPRPNGATGKGKAVAVSNGYGSSEEEVVGEEEEEQEQEPQEESMAILNGGDDYGVENEEEQEPDPEEEEEEEVATPPSAKVKRTKGRPAKKPAPAPEPVEEEADPDAVLDSIEEDVGSAEEEQPVRAGNKRGRLSTKKGAAAEAEKQPAKKKAKRAPDAGDEQGVSSSQAAAPKPRGRPLKAVSQASGRPDASAVPAKARPGPKKAAQKRTSTGVGDTSVADVPRGPPLPKARGLLISRRETPGAGTMTRSGRASFQPLKFWANERVEREDDEFFDGKENIVLPHIKNIVRVDDPEPSQTSRRKGKAGKGRGRKRRGGLYAAAADLDDDLEEWEAQGDVITGEVVVWQPEHEHDPPGPDEQIEVATDEQIAVSANAITTREIRGASFKFAKTLSMPFFGAGVVDLPPSAEKKPKNARKMHMSFFVFAGRVQVTVASTVFSIGRGGMWFVPRGNYYSIENISDRPARIFFSQGCEINAMVNADASQMAS